MTVRNLRRVGPAIVVALAATLSGCGGGGMAQALAPVATPDLPGVVAPILSPSPTPAPTPARSSTPSAAPRARPGTAPTRPVTITIKNFAFMPMSLKLRVGQTLVVTNLDDAAHTITAEDGSFDSGNLEKGQSFRFRATKAGTYGYYCDYHQYMTGTIEVS